MSNEAERCLWIGLFLLAIGWGISTIVIAYRVEALSQHTRDWQAEVNRRLVEFGEPPIEVTADK